MLAEAETDDFINDAPKPQLDQSGEWQETSGEIQWVAAENNANAENDNDKKDDKKEDEEEELDLNKGEENRLTSAFKVPRRLKRYFPCCVGYERGEGGLKTL